MQRDMKFRLWQPCKCIMFVCGVLSLAPCYSGKFERQVRRADQALYPIQSGSFVGRGPWLYATSPCKCEKIPCKSEKVRIKEVLHLFRCYTHTLYKICLSVPDMVFADTYIQTDRQSDRHTDIQKVRQTYRQTYIHTDIQADIHTYRHVFPF